MQIVDDIFKGTRLNASKAKVAGFVRREDAYCFETLLLGGQFVLAISVSDGGFIETHVTDAQTQEEYVLHLMGGGSFAGKVRDEFQNALVEIRDTCFEKDIFKSAQAKRIIAHVRTKYGDELEFLWKKFSDNAIWRRQDNQKWFGVLVVISRRKLGIESDELADVLIMRVSPDERDAIVDGKRTFPGYHMNKKSWFSVCLDETFPDETLFDWIEKSRALALKK